MVRCAMQKTKIIGPYFFRRSSVDCAAYKSMIRYYGLQHVEQLLGSPIFQQDGAPAHSFSAFREYLSRELGNNWICKQRPIDWQEKSPDLTSLDFLLWGYVKDKVYSERIESLDHLKTRIRHAISIIDTATWSNVWKNIHTRVNCVDRQERKAYRADQPIRIT